MGKLLKYWKSHIVYILMILGLLIVQAYCDLELPSYTADIVDTGITGGGIENQAPIKLSKESYDNICMLLTEEETKELSTYYDLKGDIYKRNTDSEKKIKQIEQLVNLPMVILGQMAVAEDGEQTMSLKTFQQMYAAGQVSDEMKLSMRSNIAEFGGDNSDMLIKNQCIAFIKAEYEKIGVDTDKIQMNYLIKKGAMMLLYAVIGMLMAIAVGFIASMLSAKVGMELREGVFKKVITYSSAEINQFSTASLITRSTNDIQQVQGVTFMVFRVILYAPVLAVGGIVKVLNTNTGLEWIIALAVVALLSFVFLLMAIAMPKFKIMQNMVDKLNLVAREILTGVLVIRAFGREKEEEKRFDDANTQLMKTQLFTNRVMTFMFPVMTFLMNGVSVMIVWFGAKGIDKGNLMVGDMMSFITYAIMIIMSFLMLSMISVMLPRASVAAVRVDEILNTDSTILDSQKSQENDAKLNVVRGELQFNDVSFCYPGGEEDALTHLSFTAKPGQTTAIIGSTGCGKSTLLNLIPRFYDVTQGSITIDGVDIRDISQKKLRSMLGYVPQKGVLFSGNIESNLKYGGEDITDEDMEKAAEIAQAKEFINEKRDKYQSEIAQGGTNVSGGQKQRLSIARAIAKHPKIFLFDDSFSALDYKTDVVLRKALQENISDATVIIVAQRISTILHADQILVLDEGRIAGIGNHEELMRTCEAYQEIAKSQLSEKELKGGHA